jgi:16S rRNA (guanine966-N2)-methyltransferase
LPRIIAGQFKGRVLKSPKGNQIRPTLDRVKESLFSILGSELSGRYVVDLFAGTGSLGLEALSRGAEHVVLVEKEHGPLDAIRENIAALGVRDRVTLIPLAVLRVIPSLPKADLVFCDPPYALSDLDEVVSGLFFSKVLKPGGLLVLETRTKRQVACPKSAELVDERVYSDTKLMFFRPLPEA